MIRSLALFLKKRHHRNKAFFKDLGTDLHLQTSQLLLQRIQIFQFCGEVNDGDCQVMLSEVVQHVEVKY